MSNDMEQPQGSPGRRRNADMITTDIFAGGGEMGALMHSLDWGSNPLGPVTRWPQSLRTVVSISLMSHSPMAICWGPAYILLYNDAYRLILGTKHPWAMGRPYFEVWSELTHIVRPVFDEVIETCEATWFDDLMLPMLRHDYLEEAYFTVSYTAIRGESGRPEGILATVTETTEHYLAERRLQLVRELSDAAGRVRSLEQATDLASAILARHSADVPFSLLYMVHAAAGEAHLAAMTGIQHGHPAAPAHVPLADLQARPWPLGCMLDGAEALVVDNLAEAGPLPGGSWPNPAHKAILLPIPHPISDDPIAVLVAGVNPRRALDTRYHEFFRLVACQIANIMANAIAHEETRKHSEMLAELDRTKTAFFSSVSHEFRTPLTLMLGSIEDVLAHSPDLPADSRHWLDGAHGHALRLLKLVNTLLDFSRIEAGHMQASYEPTNLAALTAELASVFRSAIECTGLQLIVNCQPLPEPVYVDPEMWKKIVFNLLSSAFKFTCSGEIEIALQQADEMVELIVRDTGTGISAEELPHLFECFHRVKGARGRTFEGSEIGLAFVQELVKLHHGTVRVENEIDRGTTFRVGIRLGTAHLDAYSIGAQRTPAPDVLRSEVSIEEALRGLPKEPSDFQAPDSTFTTETRKAAHEARATGSARILLADNNTDMRDYIRRLLSQKYEVIAVSDGVAALQAVRQQPFDLVLAEVMMPQLDGFGLLTALRSDEQTETLPVILLSTRASEEARTQGIQAGADDYLVKPISPRVLVARVSARLKMAHVRRAVARREQQLRVEAQATRERLEGVLAGIKDDFVMYDHDWRYVYVNDRAAQTLGYSKAQLLGQRIWDLFPNAVGNLFYQKLHQAVAEGQEIAFEHYYQPWDRWFENRAYPIAEGVLLFSTDITDRKRAEEALRESERRLRMALQGANAGAWNLDVASGRTYWSEEFLPLYGYDDATPRTYEQWIASVHPDDRERVEADFRARLNSDETEFRQEFRIIHPQQGVRWLLDMGRIERDAHGVALRFDGINLDITERKCQEEQLHRIAKYDAFRVALSDALRPLQHADEIKSVAARVLGQHLQVDRVYYAEVEPNDEYIVVPRDYYTNGKTANIAGRFRIGDFSQFVFRELHAARPVVIADTQTVTEDTETERAAYLAIEVRAFIACPLVKAGRLAVVLGITQSTPRVWTSEEIAQAKETAERTWAAVERALAEAALRESEERFRNMADHAPVMVWVTEADGACTYLSESWYEFTGQTSKTGRSFGWLDATHPDDREQAEKMFIAATEQRKPIRLEYRMQRKDGEYRWAIDSAAPRFGPSGTFLGYIGSVLDITERKRAEFDREHLFEREQELRQQAEQANRLKDEFLATVSHELRTPLTAFLGYAQMLLVRRRDESYIVRTVEKMVQSAKAQAQIIDDLLDVSRIVSGKLRIEPQCIDLIPVIRAALDTMRPAVEAKSLNLHIDLSPDASAIIGDANRLQQVVWNLLSNATKFTPPDGTIHVRLEPHGRDAQLTISDTGQGISKTFLPYVFDRFRQAESTSNRTYGGLGLGLAIVRHLVELHGGTVQAASAGEGQGAIFTVRLPLAINDDATEVVSRMTHEDSTVSDCPTELRGMRVLLVDDQPNILELLHDVLASCGAVVRVCNTAQEALEMVRTWQPDVLVSDIAMPDEDGYWLIRHVRALASEDGGTVPAVALTADVRLEERLQVLEAGFQLYVPKPVDPAELRNVVAHLVRTPAGD